MTTSLQPFLPSLPNDAGLYIHWPFCERKCPYCDFFSRTVERIPHEEMGAALLAEWCARRDELGTGRLVSVYVGGGTPSLMRPREVGALLEAVDRTHSLSEAEITLEANPHSANSEWFQGMRAAGVNRLSLGAQSFSPEILAFLGRLHTPEETLNAVAMARRAGFDNLSLDLILATHPSSPELLVRDIRALLALLPEHVSAYLLSIEDTTPFGLRARKGETLAKSDEEARAQYERAAELLKAAGYAHYEISNFAKPGRESRHNGLYWSGATYLGLGPGAHSFMPPTTSMPGLRRANEGDIDAYLRTALEANGEVGAAIERLTRQDHERDIFLTALRRAIGLGEEEFLARAGRHLDERERGLFDAWEKNGYGAWFTRANGERAFRLQAEGWLISDDLLADLF